ncbi:hypothetical protein J6590_014867 [Homalodisca vitripennis]|nr:hypothetical protein J6590_014867 [Homalodisca vitripennis]
MAQLACVNCSLTYDIFWIAALKQLFTCEKCGRNYKYRESLSRHRHHECNVAPSFCCDFCPFKTKRKDSLSLHVAARHCSQVFDIISPPGVLKKLLDCRRRLGELFNSREFGTSVSEYCLRGLKRASARDERASRQSRGVPNYHRQTPNIYW